MALSSKPVIERSDVLEAIWHSQGLAVKCCSKEEMLKKKSLGSFYSQWEEKVRFLPRTTELDLEVSQREL